MIILLVACFLSILGVFESIFGAISLIVLFFGCFRASAYGFAAPNYIFAIVIGIFIIPRGVLLSSGLIDPFHLFYFDPQNNEWIVAASFSALFFYMGSRFAANLFLRRESLKVRWHEQPSPMTSMLGKRIALPIMGCGLLLFSLYVKNLGGIFALINGFNASTYSDITANASLSTIKNLSIYLVIGGFVLYAASTRHSDRTSFIVISFVVALVSIGFIKREYLFETIIAFALTLHRHHWIKSKLATALLAMASFIILFGLYVARSGIAFNGNSPSFDLFNSAEFWIADQFIQVFQLGTNTFGSDSGVRFFYALSAPFSDFLKYIPFDWEITEKMTGISKWGIPSTILGYLYLSWGLFGLLVGLFFIGGSFQYLGYICLRLTAPELRAMSGAILVMFSWFLLRNGDPVSAVFYVNRYILVLTIGFLAIRFFTPMNSKIFKSIQHDHPQ